MTEERNFAASPIGQGIQHSYIQPHYLALKLPTLFRALRLLVFPTDFVTNFAICLVLTEARKRSR